MSSAGTKWTPAQLAAIRTTGKNLLVSAAAGSGKTSVLAERCAYLVCDAPEPCEIDELLVVTYTEHAAAEMRSRIQRTLRERFAAHPSDRLQQQLLLVEQAQISTLHSFCLRILKQHYTRVGLDPTFRLLAEQEGALLRAEVVEKLFHDRYEEPDNGRFLRLIDDYGDGNDRGLRRKVLAIHSLLTSVIDPDGWRKDALARLHDAAEKPFEQSTLGQELIASIRASLQSLLMRARVAYGTVNAFKRFPAYVQAITECGQIVRHLIDVLDNHGYDALQSELEFKFDRLPAVKSDVPDKDFAKGFVDDLREELKKGGWRKSLQPSSEWKAGLERTLDPSEELLELVAEFGRRFQAAKHEINALDFSDLERLSHRILWHEGEPTRIAKLYRKRFCYVLVDEFQDTNELQESILRALSRETNRFAVGDVKQSIYRFRLAEPMMFLNIQKQYRSAGDEGDVIDLQNNFRSRSSLLEAINSVFERTMTGAAVDIEYDQSQRLVPGMNYPANGFPGAPMELHLLPAKLESTPDDSPEAAELDRTDREAMLLAKLINDLLGQGEKPRAEVTGKDGNLRPIEFGDITILLRSMKFKARQFADTLRAAGIPIHYESNTGFLESQEIRDMRSVLSLLDNQRQDIPLVAYLRSPLVQWPGVEDALATIRATYSKQEAPNFHDAVGRYLEEHNDAIAEHGKRAMWMITCWRILSQRNSVAEVVRRIFEDTKYCVYVAGLPGGDQRVANLLKFQDDAREFANFDRQGVSRFMRFLDQLEEEESDLGRPSVESGTLNVVRIMSIHASKGLEFPVVFLPDLGKEINLSDTYGSILAERSAGLGLHVADPDRRVRYPSLASLSVNQQLRQQSFAEEMRVLYVAMTRAREHLVLIGSVSPDAPEKWRSRWANHSGTLPPETILNPGSMLDWIGPVWAATELDADAPLALIQHSPEEIAAWTVAKTTRPQFNALQTQMANLEPLKPAPAVDELAQDIIDSISFTYPFQPLSRVRSANTVTNIAKKSDLKPQKGLVGQSFPDALPLPDFLESVRAPGGAEIGAATHLLLEHFDFRAEPSAAEIEKQIKTLVSRKLLSSQQAGMVDRDSVEWFLNSEVGELIRSHWKILRREIPVSFVEPVEGHSDPLDAVLVRGRLDLLIPLPAGQVIVDYKTDHVEGERLQERIRLYSKQMYAYREAIARITQLPVGKIALVFLHAKHVEWV